MLSAAVVSSALGLNKSSANLTDFVTISRIGNCPKFWTVQYWTNGTFQLQITDCLPQTNGCILECHSSRTHWVNTKHCPNFNGIILPLAIKLCHSQVSEVFEYSHLNLEYLFILNMVDAINSSITRGVSIQWHVLPMENQYTVDLQWLE